MQVRVELYGIPRHRAGTAALDVEAESLGEVFRELGVALPQLEGLCVQGGVLCGGYLANLDGQTFVSDPALRLRAGQTVLVLSSDVGG